MLTLALLAGQALAAKPLDYKAAPFKAEVVSETRTRGRVERLVRFPSPMRSLFEPNNTVWAHYVRPEGATGPLPTILVLPVMAAPNVWIETRFVNRFVRDGFAVLWLEMPYQFHRKPHPSMPSGQAFLSRRADRLAQNFRQSALDARRALDWLRRQPDVDLERVGVFGVSLGALVGSVVYSVDPLPRHAVFLLGGADFPSLAVESSMTGPFLRQSGIAIAALRAAWVGIDPLDYRLTNAGKRALLINARSDAVIPKSAALKLREAFPDARQVWVPFGHYTALLHLVWVPRYVSREFQAAFADKISAKAAKGP